MAINDIVIIALILISTISGFFAGFAKKSSKLVSLAGAGLICFYLGGAISGWMCEAIDPIRTWLESNDWGYGLVLALCYIAIFLIALIILKLIMKLVDSLLQSNVVFRALNKVLGLVAGICIGFVLADVYVWALYGLSMVSSDIALWVSQDALLANTFTKAIMDFNLNLINGTFPL